MGTIGRDDYRRRERGRFGGEFWASNYNQWGLRCVTVRQQRTLPKLLREDLLCLVLRLETVTQPIHIMLPQQS